MSSIGNNPRNPTASSSNQSLSDIAKNEGLFQDSSTSGSGATGDTDGAQGAKGTHGKGKPVGKGATAAVGMGAKSGPGVSQGVSVLPDPSAENGGLPSGQDTQAINELAANQGGSDVASASQKLSADLAVGQASQATLSADIGQLQTALTNAGITTPVGQVVLDLVDPKGTGVAPSKALAAAAQASGVDLSQDHTHLAQAQSALTAAVNATPANADAVNVATAHVIRASGLSNSSASAALSTVVASASTDGGSGLAALYASAAANGVDITNSGDDKTAQAENSAAQNRASRARIQAAQTARSNSGGGGSGGGSGGTSSRAGSGANVANAGQANASGSGSSGDLNNAATSQTYTGQTIDQLLAGNSDLSNAMKANPDLVAAIRTASAATGVPGGLLAAQAYEESSFGANATTTTDADGDPTGGVMQLNQAYIDTYVPGGSISNTGDNVMACAKSLAASYATTQSWGSALRVYNSTGIDGPVPNPSDLSNIGGAGNPSYVKDILTNAGM